MTVGCHLLHGTPGMATGPPLCDAEYCLSENSCRLRRRGFQHEVPSRGDGNFDTSLNRTHIRWGTPTGATGLQQTWKNPPLPATPPETVVPFFGRGNDWQTTSLIIFGRVSLPPTKSSSSVLVWPRGSHTSQSLPPSWRKTTVTPLALILPPTSPTAYPS